MTFSWRTQLRRLIADPSHLALALIIGALVGATLLGVVGDTVATSRTREINMAVRTPAPQVGRPPADEDDESTVARPIVLPSEQLLVEEVSIDGMCGVY